MDNEVDDGFVEADFIGGAWDGKTYSIPFVQEFRIALLKEPVYHYRQGEYPRKNYDIAVYKHIVNGIYWLNRIERTDG